MLKRGVWIILFILLGSSVLALRGDFDDDGCVNMDDFFLFADHYGEILEEKSIFDLSGDGEIDVEGRLTIIIQKPIYEINESPIILTAVDESVIISKDKPLALDKIFNEQNISITDFPKGDYYVVATFLTSNNSTFQSSYKFTVV